MKKTLLLSLALSIAFTMMADMNGSGYYRVENYVTKRYISVIDTKGRIDFGSTSADLQAIRLDRNFNNVSHDPASILYIQPSGNEYNISAQGTSVKSIIDHYLNLQINGSSGGQKLYMAYGKYDGATRYLGDQTNATIVEEGKMSINCRGDYRKWFILPVNASGDNYFGIEPSVSISTGKFSGLYASVYGSFPMSAYSTGVKIFTVDKVSSNGFVTLKELSGIVPANTPLIVKCGGESPSDNRMNVGGEASGVSISANFKGVFFNCGISGHINRTAYDPKTMRVLGTCSDGSLGFVTANIDYIPANTAYLTVPAWCPAEYKIVDEATYVAGVDEIGGEESLKTVYTLTGMKVGDRMTAAELHNLPSGIYIVNGKKVKL